VLPSPLLHAVGHHPACQSLCFITSPISICVIGATVTKPLRDIRGLLKLNAALVQVPIGSESNFQGVVDVISRKGYLFEGPNGEVSNRASLMLRLCLTHVLDAYLLPDSRLRPSYRAPRASRRSTARLSARTTWRTEERYDDDPDSDPSPCRLHPCFRSSVWLGSLIELRPHLFPCLCLRPRRP
jgi:hypothetical protein